MVFKIGDLVTLKGVVKIVTGSRLTELSEEYTLTGVEGWIARENLTIRFFGNEGSVLRARNMIFGDKLSKKDNAKPSLVVEVVDEAQGARSGSTRVAAVPTEAV